jgi:hypothetical protein
MPLVEIHYFITCHTVSNLAELLLVLSVKVTLFEVPFDLHRLKHVLTHRRQEDREETSLLASTTHHAGGARQALPVRLAPLN